VLEVWRVSLIWRWGKHTSLAVLHIYIYIYIWSIFVYMLCAYIYIYLYIYLYISTQQKQAHTHSSALDTRTDISYVDRHKVWIDAQSFLFSWTGISVLTDTTRIMQTFWQTLNISWQTRPDPQKRYTLSTTRSPVLRNVLAFTTANEPLQACICVKCVYVCVREGDSERDRLRERKARRA